MSAPPARPPGAQADIQCPLPCPAATKLIGRQVMHDCRADSEALFYLHGIRMRAVWDTQVGAWLAPLAKQVNI